MPNVDLTVAEIDMLINWFEIADLDKPLDNGHLELRDRLEAAKDEEG